MIRFYRKVAFVFTLIFFVLCAFTNAHAENTDLPIPSNTTIKCNQTAKGSEDEFHSLRPYQKNIQCTSSTSDYATYCGNDLTLSDLIEVSYPGSNANCKTEGTKIICNYVVDVSKSVTISLDNAELPIMGNTEDVINSQNSEDTLTDVQKLSDYVSWYLNGVTSRAEYGSSNNTNEKLINFSGPVKKLLPQAIQQARQIQTIDAAKKTQHDKVVVCTSGDNPVGCYDDGANVSDVYRLTSWNGKLSLTRGITNIFKESVLFFTRPLGLSETLDNYIGTAWNEKVPPLPWDSRFGGDGNLYLKAYREWQGDTCAIIPIIDRLVCVRSPLVTNTYSQLFSYVPLSSTEEGSDLPSSTEDLQGEIIVNNKPSAAISVGIGSAKLTNISFSNQKGTGEASSILFFPHMEEVDELGSILQDTYVPKDAEKTGETTDISTTSCKEAEVRTNAGDNLFANQIEGNLSYTATFSCQYNNVYCSKEKKSDCLNVGLVCQENVDGGTCVNSSSWSNSTQYCVRTVNVKLTTKSNTPKADSVWERLVAGPMSVFKRIFPKTNVEGSVGQIIDIAGSTNVSYSGTNIEDTTASLKIPHVGGVSEYFLKGIQTALRPKGYGNTISFAKGTAGKENNGEVDCDKNAPDVSSLVPNLIPKEALHDLAVLWEGGIEGDHVLECYNDVVGKSLDAGVDPAFSLLLWINESGGSNYDISWQDFGINYSYYKGFTAQLNQFLTRPSYYKQDSRWSSCFGKGVDTEMFFSVYYAGYCDPDNLEPGSQYIQLVKETWGWFTSCDFKGYPFSTDCF